MKDYEYKRPSKAHISSVEQKGILFSGISIVTFSMFLLILKYFVKFINFGSVGLTALIYTSLLFLLLIVIKKQRLWLALGLSEPTDERESMAWGVRSSFFLGLNIAIMTVLLAELAVLLFGYKAIYVIEVFTISYFTITFGGIMLLNIISKRKIDLSKRKSIITLSIEVTLLSLLHIIMLGILGYFLIHIYSNQYILIFFIIFLLYHSIKFTNNAVIIADKLKIKMLNYNNIEDVHRVIPNKKLEAKYADKLVYSGWLREDKIWEKIKD